MSSNLYINFHVLQTVPPSCVNRDDTGSPKVALYGGITRARISSQAWKHAMRQMFRDEIMGSGQVGMRTKKITDLVAEQIAALDSQADAKKLAQQALGKSGLKVSDKGSDALFFLSLAQAKALAELILADCKDDKEFKKVLKEFPSIDMVLFGRMVANEPSLNYDAAAQVAHSISTHAVQNEYDYFTAVDDCATADNAGAGHLGTVEYNSSTLYRYATVNAMELMKHLGKADAATATRDFAEAFIRSMPTGKQNTFANRTLPDTVYVTLRCDQPVNLCGAFEQAIPASEQGFVMPSRERLIAYAKEVYKYYADAPKVSFAVGPFEDLAPCLPLTEMLLALKSAVEAHLSGSEVEK